MLVALLLCDRRVHPSCRALCLLAPRPLRVLAVTIGTAFLIGLAGALSPLLALGLLAAVVAVFAPLAARGLRNLPAQARLRTGTAPRRRVRLHSLASTQAGAGTELLMALGDEADHRGWTLVLDASNERLAGYYSSLGFVALAVGKMPDGNHDARMCRSPATTRRA